jgi:hypothetical protein
MIVKAIARVALSRFNDAPAASSSISGRICASLTVGPREC